MTPESEKSETIDARPTKELFIDILTRDISVRDCIRDLLDNSVDGYTRNKLKDRQKIEITISPEEFTIFDNCGGIDKTFLMKKVFRFGVETLSRDYATLGVYGIGLKRSIFKIGSHFTMETDDGKTYNKIDLDVNNWKNKTEWELPFSSEDSKIRDADMPYTEIKITDIHEDVKKSFNLTSFIEDLRETVSVTYSLIIEKKVDIYINNKAVDPFPFEFTYAGPYKPSRIKEEYGDVGVDIVCGVNPRGGRSEKLVRRGWNIFCNERLIVMDDITKDTGWSGEKSELPKFHNIFNEFKGLVFITSNDSSKLPLNTSKNGLNKDTAVYHKILNLMIKQARPVINVLRYKYEKQEGKQEGIDEEVGEILEEKYGKKRATDIKVGTKFSAPSKSKPTSELAQINYEKPRKLIEKVKKHLKVRSARKVGEKTFDYYVEMEEVENE